MKKGKATPKNKAEPKAPINLMARLDAPEQRQQLLNTAFPTVFNMAAQSVQQVLAVDPTMHITEARPLLEQAKALTVSNARLFREQRLSAGVRTAYAQEPGIQGLIPGSPTYTHMFTPDWAAQCPPGAIEATTSPIAYLTDLYREAEDIEKNATPGRNIPLATRRPDLANLELNHTTLNKVEPTLVLVNEILETSIRKHLNDHSEGDTLVDDALLKTRYPHTLPYERYQQQINHVLGTKQRSLGDAVRCIDRQYPYFKEVGGRSPHSDDALQLDTGFGPEQQRLLLEAPYFGEDTANNIFAFFQTNYGVQDYTRLLNTQTFCLHTGLSTDELDSLLSTGPYAPTQSPNTAQASSLDGALFGSVYINAGQNDTTPAIAIEPQYKEDDGTTRRVIDYYKLINISFDRFDRINRMIRLARWLGLPFDQVDRLLLASFAAQQQSETRTFTAATLQITPDTLRSLGLFQRLRATYNVTADDFAALLDGLATVGRGKELSQFDRVFNSQALFPTPFKLDDSEFEIIPTKDTDIQKIDQLCAALGMSYESFRFTAKLIKQSLDGVEPEAFKQQKEALTSPKLKWSNVVISAFYRMARLPRYLGLSTIEALALLELLDKGGSKLVSQLAGRTSVSLSAGATSSDTLSALHALVDFSTWLNDNQWTVSMICRTLLPGQSRSIASEVENNVIRHIYQGLEATLITASAFAEAAIPMPPPAEAPNTRKTKQAHGKSAAIDWFTILKAFIDDGSETGGKKGLILHLGVDEQQFEAKLSCAIDAALPQEDPDRLTLHEKLLTIILRSRDAQEALILEGLALYLAVPAHLARSLMQWASGNRYLILKDVLQYSAATDTPVSHVFLPLLSTLVNLATVTDHLKLSPTLIDLLADKPAWFGLPDSALTLNCLYILTQYTRILSLSEQSEDALLNYFHLINNAWPTARMGDKPLYRDSSANKLATFLQWGAREVLATGFHLHPAGVPEPQTKKTRARRTLEPDGLPIPGVIITLPELDVVVRIAQMCRLIGLDAKALLDLGNLTFASTTQAYRRAAEQALSCLVEGLANKPSGEVGQSTTTAITVVDDYLVANMPTSHLAVLTLTLKDYMDQVMPETTVTWRTNLGRLLTMEEEGAEADPTDPGDSSENTGELTLTTDENGLCRVRLKSGKIMGMARVTAHYGLDSEALAPSITIDCDEGSIVFNEYAPKELQPVRSNNEGAITFSVKLEDGYGNLVINRMVEWSTTIGEFQGFNPRTNHHGISSVTLRSRSHGEGDVIAEYKNRTGVVPAKQMFESVIFTRHPYFQYVRFDDFVMQYMDEGLSCRLVELNGDPLVDKTITWATNKGTLTGSPSKTDNNGVTTARFTHDVKEDVKITVSTDVMPGVEAIADKSIVAYVNPPPVIKRHSQSGSEMVMGTEDLTFNIWLESEGKPARYVDITWTVLRVDPSGEEKTVEKESNVEGMSSFSYGDFKVGAYKVIATVNNTPASHAFEVSCKKPDVSNPIPGSLYTHTLGTPAVEFSMDLEVLDFVIPDIGINWFINGVLMGNSRTDLNQQIESPGTIKVAFDLSKFPVGPSTVTAVIEGTDAVLHTFNVNGITRVITYTPDTDPVFYVVGKGDLAFNIELENGNTLDPEVCINWKVGSHQKQLEETANGVSNFCYGSFDESVETTVVAMVEGATPPIEKVFNVKAVNPKITNHSPLDINYIVDSTPRVSFWLELTDATIPTQGYNVEWAVEGKPSEIIATDSSGRSALKDQAFALGITKVTARIILTGEFIEYSVNTHKVVVSATSSKNIDYLLGDVLPVLYIKLAGEDSSGTFPAEGVPVTWKISGKPDKVIHTIADGISGFSPTTIDGTTTSITAHVPGLMEFITFNVNVKYFSITTINTSNEKNTKDNFLSRGTSYTLVVHAKNSSGTPIEGIEFSLRSSLSSEVLSRNGIEITGLESTYNSTVLGTNINVKLQYLQGSEFDSSLAPLLTLIIDRPTRQAVKSFDFTLGYLLVVKDYIQSQNPKKIQIILRVINSWVGLRDAKDLRIDGVELSILAHSGGNRLNFSFNGTFSAVHEISTAIPIGTKSILFSRAGPNRTYVVAYHDNLDFRNALINSGDDE
ncbi:Ig-like domain-containing protein [Pseudomonas sp. Z1-29]|uniref:Tc toxin subunit A n=1 Tax=Pseudomonas sp. Z1-29 TaxID=2817410 RepID=UPI003DA9783A